MVGAIGHGFGDGIAPAQTYKDTLMLKSKVKNSINRVGTY